ncbi:putative DNA binding domain-containing protein [Gordonia sp. GW1C4-4]|jgi:ATP-dependent DNA helicase RecG|uniref:DNA binding domain-containing protein n=2 Tax=Gordoniaceae TaxID=85026 RepID=A0ABS9DEX6_9ACTN|nr:RNA-binding domain-containing protein [Gordonia sp. (in: high G+C Gram-positive bacteria)]MAU82966.1 AAA family ATPase [Gordonia sp. (in: high G+C Gram-positive bacteria)]MCF3936854.1 putative DNA binding domain-containing protein [Gordonia tangerina]
MESRALIAGGETFTTEFKRSDISAKDLTKAVACLANGEGGVLLIGVDDDGTVVGASPRHGQVTNPERVAAYIQANTEPALAVGVHLETIDGHEVIRIDVPRADPGPVGTKLGVFTKRVLKSTGQPECAPMTAHEIVSMGMVTRGQDFAASIARDASMDDLDPLEFDRFRRLCQEAGDELADLSDDDVLRALGLVPIAAPVSIGAVLLFGTDAALQRWVPNAEVLFQDARSGHQSTNIRIAEPLLGTAERLRELIDARNTVTELMAGLYRIEIPLIPSITRREAVANALVHRDYAAVGPIRVQLNDSSFVVANPGGFPPGVTTQNILDQSRPRSPILAAAFKRAGLVERRGKGVNDMFEQQLRAGRDAPDYSHSTSESVVVTVPLGNADLDLVRFLLTWESDHQEPLSLDELRIVHEVKTSGSATSFEVAGDLNLISAIVKSSLGHLVECGILESRGVGRSRKYHLTARFYDLAQDRNAYVRVKGIDPLQQERMILDYADAYGSITRGQAAELCQTTPTQARSVLKRLVEDGRLRLTGERRGARYVPRE